MITKSRKKNNKLVSTPPSPKRLQLFPIKFTYFFQIIDFTILTSVPTEPRADIRLITRCACFKDTCLRLRLGLTV